MPSSRPHEAPLPDPVAYFLTWNTYGTWLPCDERGWVEYRHGWQLPDPMLELESAALMTEDACRLSPPQRRCVEVQVEETCRVRGWRLWAVNCRSNHIHVVVSASVNPKQIRNQLKAWCTRRLKALNSPSQSQTVIREHWWAERGSQRFINDEASLEAAILYVRDFQDRPQRFSQS